MKLKFALILGVILSLCGAVIDAQDELTTQDYQIELDGWTSDARLTLPAESTSTLVILFPGSGPYDLDATVYDYATNVEEPISTNFLTIAETLASEGYAVLRVNKRGVNAVGDYDMAALEASTIDTLIADANTVIDFAQTLEDVDVQQIVLYGWSEGAVVVSNVATMRDDVDALVLQAPPNSTLDATLGYQYQEVGLDYFREADTDGDGLLSLEDVANTPPGPLQSMVPYFFYEPGSPADNPTVNTFVDQNADGQIDIEGELAPAIDLYLSNFAGFIPEVDASYTVAELVSEAGLPTLILHGEMDGWVPVSEGQAIAEAAPDLVTLETYPALGHALSETDALATDGFYPIADEPLEDLVNWLDSTLE